MSIFDQFNAFQQLFRQSSGQQPFSLGGLLSNQFVPGANNLMTATPNQGDPMAMAAAMRGQMPNQGGGPNPANMDALRARMGGAQPPAMGGGQFAGGAAPSLAGLLGSGPPVQGGIPMMQAGAPIGGAVPGMDAALGGMRGLLGAQAAQAGPPNPQNADEMRKRMMARRGQFGRK